MNAQAELDFLRTPLSPNRKFSDFFSQYSLHKEDIPDLPTGVLINVGKFLTISGGSERPELPYTSCYVAVTPEVIRLAASNLIVVDRDEIYFELIVHADDAYLYFKYNQIIGSRLLAILDLNTLPTNLS
jgi:hypothetical protein